MTYFLSNLHLYIKLAGDWLGQLLERFSDQKMVLNVQAITILLALLEDGGGSPVKCIIIITKWWGSRKRKIVVSRVSNWMCGRPQDDERIKEEMVTVQYLF